MIKSDANGSETLDRLRKYRAKLAELLPQLEGANAAFASAAEPMSRLSNLDLQQRRELANRIRATTQEWEQVTTQINQALADINTVSSPSAGRQS